MSVEEARAPRQQEPAAHDGFVPPSSRRGDRALAEMLGEAACVASLDDLAALLARGLVDVFCARSSLVYLATRNERSLVLVASRNADDPAPIVDIEWALPAARAARRRANVFLSFPPAPSDRGGAVSSTGSPLAFAAPILVGPRLIGAFSAGFSRGLSPDRCAALGSLGDALGALAAHL
jgi:hypothetical protein